MPTAPVKGGQRARCSGAWSNPLLAGHKFHTGDVFVFESTGGGGRATRSGTVEEVLDDVLDGYISVEAAESTTASS